MIKSEKCLWYILYWISCLTITWQCMAKECIPLPLNHWSGFIWYFPSLMPTHMLWSWFLNISEHDFDLIQYIFLVTIQDESHIGLKIKVSRIFAPWHTFLNQSRMIHGSRITWKSSVFMIFSHRLKTICNIWKWQVSLHGTKFLLGHNCSYKIDFQSNFNA